MSERVNVYPFEFDTRMIEWNLKTNLVSKDQFKKHLDSLPDDGANAVALTLEDDGTSSEGNYQE